MTETTLDEFTAAYVNCALWSSADDDGEPLDANYSAADIHPDTIEQMVADCRVFQDSPYVDITSDDRGGHDFWLTRNGHGAGFSDGDWDDNPDNARALAAQAEGFGEFNLYVGDDGLIHGS